MTTTRAEHVMTERERFIDGLRVLAAALEAHPDLPLPSDGSTSFSALHWSFWGDDAREQMALAASGVELECPSCNTDDPEDFRNGCEDSWHAEARLALLGEES